MYFYVIMPSERHPTSEAKREVISSIAQEFGLSVRYPRYSKSDYSFDPNASLRHIKQSTFVLADLSFERPSCYYELGLVEAVGKCAYLIAEQGTLIHQTAARDTVLFFSDLLDLERKLQTTMSSHLSQLAAG